MTFYVAKVCDCKTRLQWHSLGSVSALQATSGFCLVLFCLDAKKNQKKSRQNPIAPRVFASLRLPMRNNALFTFCLVA